MSKQLTGLQIFIASPGGLRLEREAFRAVIDRVNHDHAHAAGVTFIPRGWEYASSGIGRPQTTINEQVMESDYLLVILWDQWGTPPGGATYSSGTEEEYRVGMQCLKDPDLPMKDVIVLFRGVSERQLADPGEGLKKVLAFKSELEKTRVLLYSTFDNVDEFKDDFRQHLHKWVRDWESGKPSLPRATVDEVNSSSALLSASEERTPTTGTLAQRAKEAVDRGRFTQAEQLFAQGTTGPYDKETFTEYVRFLRKTGRLSLARDTAIEFLHAAQNADDLDGEVEALANLGILDRQQGNNAASLEYIDRALKVNDELVASRTSSADRRIAAMKTKAFLLDNRSLTLRRIPDRSDEALLSLDEARMVQGAAGDMRGAGFTLRNAGSLLFRLGRLEEAQNALNESLAIFDEVDYPNGKATVLGSLGEIYEAQGDLDRAADAVSSAVAVSPNRSPSRIAMNYAVLARLMAKKGDIEAARNFAEQGTRAAQELGTPESAATTSHATAQVALAMGDLDIAHRGFLEALDLFTQVGNSAGIAAIYVDLARVAQRRLDENAARDYLSRARAMLDRAPHFGLEQEIISTENSLT